MKQQVKQMMGMERAGFVTTNFLYRSKAMDKDFMRVVLFVE